MCDEEKFKEFLKKAEEMDFEDGRIDISFWVKLHELWRLECGERVELMVAGMPCILQRAEASLEFVDIQVDEEELEFSEIVEPEEGEEAVEVPVVEKDKSKDNLPPVEIPDGETPMSPPVPIEKKIVLTMADIQDEYDSRQEPPHTSRIVTERFGKVPIKRQIPRYENKDKQIYTLPTLFKAFFENFRGTYTLEEVLKRFKGIYPTHIKSTLEFLEQYGFVEFGKGKKNKKLYIFHDDPPTCPECGRLYYSFNYKRNKCMSCVHKARSDARRKAKNE